MMRAGTEHRDVCQVRRRVTRRFASENFRTGASGSAAKPAGTPIPGCAGRLGFELLVELLQKLLDLLAQVFKPAGDVLPVGIADTVREFGVHDRHVNSIPRRQN
jgi:hypothetical protein